MKKHLFLKSLLIAIGLLVTSLSTSMWAGTKRIYFKPGTGWLDAGAKIAIHYWGTGVDENQWMVHDGDYYYYDVPDAATQLQFVRNQSSAYPDSPGFNGATWTNTGNLSCPSSRCYVMSSYSDGAWKNIWLGGRTVYVDANNFGWDRTISSGPYLRIGRDATSAGSTSAYQMTKVANTSNLYKHYQSSDWSDYTCYCITNAEGWTNDNSVYQTGGLSWRTATNGLAVVTDVTIIPAYPGVGDGAEYGGNKITRYDNHLYDEGLLHYNLNLTRNGSGTIVINAPTDGSGTMTAFTNESGNTVPSGNVRIEAAPAEGYELTSLTMGGGALKNDEGYGYTFYYNNVESTMDIVATFTKIEEKKIYIYDSGNWKNARGKLFIHAWNATMGADNSYGNWGPELKNLGDGWYEATLSTQFTHFMISDSTDTHKSTNRAVADYTDGGRYSTATGDIPSYAASEPNIAYVEVTKSGKSYFSNTVTNTTDTMSFFYPDGATAKLYYFNSGIQNVTLTTDFSEVKDNIVTATWTGAKNANALDNLDVYDDDYHIHCYATTRNYLINGRSAYGTTGTRFTKFQTSSSFGDTYNHYWVDWFYGNSNVVATVGNDYNDDLAGIIGSDADAPKGQTKSTGGNVRYSYNPTTNDFQRAIIDAGDHAITISSDVAGKVMISTDDGVSYDQDAADPSDNRDFADASNWVYKAKAKIYGGSEATISTTYKVAKVLAEDSKLMGGDPGTQYNVEIDYDYKTNRLIAVWDPAGQLISSHMDLESNLMIARKENGRPAILNINATGQLDKVKKIYTVLELDYSSWTDAEEYGNRRITGGQYIDEYYWISLPYECLVSDIFGMKNYGSNGNWVLQTYRGDLRAEKGWWAETNTWWYDLDRSDTLKANEGYVLRVTNLNGDYYPSGTTIENLFNSGSISKLYLYFPSSGNDMTLGPLTGTVQTTADSLKCTKWRKWESDPSGKKGENNPIYDRRAVDSNWRIIGSPSFNSTKISAPKFENIDMDANDDGIVTYEEYKNAVDNYIKEHEGATPYSLKYFYNWEVESNTPKFTIANAETTEFIATHAHLVQYAGDITWNAYDGSNPLVGIKAPARYQEEETTEQTLRLVLKQGANDADVAYISRMAFGATMGYDLNMDLSKMINANSANIYTMGELYKMAGNCIPDTVETLAVGVQLAADGEYTFAMPDGTYGTGVVLIDKIAGTRTNLALTDYTVNLTAGTYDERFELELSPIAQTPTDIETISDKAKENGVRKVMVDGILYIVRDGKVFDARGNRVK